MKRTANKGFTLIELAVVIAIVAILAAVAIPRLVDSTMAAERATANDMVSQLNSAAAMYTAEQMQTPAGFTDFVTTNAIAAGQAFTLSVNNFGPNADTSPCTVAANTIDCSATFNRLTTVQYTWTNGAIQSNILPAP